MNDYNLNLDLAEFKRGKDKSKRKRKSMSGLRHKDMDKLTAYDKLNLPLRAGSVLHQSSREARSWINMAKDFGFLKRPLTNADKRAWIGEGRNWVREGRGWFTDLSNLALKKNK